MSCVQSKGCQATEKTNGVFYRKYKSVVKAERLGVGDILAVR